ncbi:MAG TPA: amino acid adenylation domain-containing protein [Kofleriaceae bacterium]|nr:amino acid adenylation domain-containing protein [Kofleriaceae bacterium]
MQVNVAEYLERGALATCPGKTAIIDGASRYTFADLERCSKRCASLIIKRLEGTSAPIAVFLPKGATTIFADLGIIYSGNAYSNLDVKSPAQRVKNILGNLRPVLVITNRALQASVAELGVEPGQIMLVDDVFDESLECNTAAIAARRDRVIDTDPLCIINTSGSTGVPKGVVMHHRSVIDFMDWVMDRLELDGTEVIGSLSPFYFDIYTLELYLALAKGSTIVIIPDELPIFPAKLVAFLVEREISFIFWVPTIMVNIANLGLLDTADLSKLKKIFFAGEVFPTKHLNVWRRRLPDAQFVNLYGPIEITVDCTYFIVDREFRDDEALPIGFPCRNTDILILDEHDRPAKDNAPGELCVRGSSLALGYWNDPEKTAKAFVQNPLNTHYPELIYRTGDLVCRNDRGEIQFLGRKDFQIKHLGYRIELGEIEHLVTSSGLVDNACVLYHRERKEITLFFEAKQQVQPATIRQGLASVLPKYMLPTVFHQMETLPRNPNGKIDRQGLMTLLENHP